MKKIRLVVLTFLIALGSTTYMAYADIDVSAGIQISSKADFYQPLNPLGAWVNLASYGRCWHPNGVPQDWEPYVNGQWVWTDVGWYWQSDEPWSWACYHYGSWVDDPSHGWCWIPGVEWAPSWVTWRVSDNMVGWAPCGPGLSVLAPSAFVFVGLHDFHRHFRGRHDFVVNNPGVINQTHVVNNFSRREVNINGRPERIAVNEGLPVDRVEHATGTRFTPRPVQELVRQTRHPNAQPEHSRETPDRPGAEQQPHGEKPPQYTPQTPERSVNPSEPRHEPTSPSVPPTGREHGSVQPPDQRPGQPPSERPPVPSPSETRPYHAPNEVPVPPTGREHGSPQPPEQHPVQPPSERPPVQAPSDTRPYHAPNEVPVPPTGHEHGSLQPPDQPPSVHAQPPTAQPPVQEQHQRATSPSESSKPAAPSPTGRERGSAQPPEKPAAHAQPPPASSDDHDKQAQ